VAQTTVLSATPAGVKFLLAFNKPVTGFGASGLTLGGTAGATTLAVAPDGSNDGKSFVVTVTGIARTGTVDLGVLANAAADSAGNPSLAFAGPIAADVTIPTAPTARNGDSLVGSLAVGADTGSKPVIRVYDPRTNAVRYEQTVFDDTFTGGVRVASADFNGDGIEDAVVGTGPGISSLVRVLDGKTGKHLFTVQPFEREFIGGVYVAAGDLNGDGVPELIVTPDEGGGPVVAVYDNAGRQIVRFLGIDDGTFRGGSRAAIGDFNGDGKDDLIVAAGFGGGPRIAIFDGFTVPSGAPTRLVSDFFAFEQGLRNGVFISAGDLNGDGRDDLIFGGGPGGGPRIRAADAFKLLKAGSFNTLDEVPDAQLANFIAGNESDRGGIRVGAEDIDGDDRIDIVVGSGTKGASKITAYAGKSILANGLPPVLEEFEAFSNFASGVFVG